MSVYILRPLGGGMPARAHEVIDRESLRQRASDPLSAEPRPFLRWAGSKRSLASELVPLLPAKFGTYWEPFLGSAALFFLLRPKRARLSDKCAELIDVYQAVSENVSAVSAYLRPLRPDPDLYYSIRENRSSGRFKRAAEFLYLNKTCWNGLYRVNSDGRFNVPYGKPKTDFLMDFGNLRACSEALANARVELMACDFEVALTDVRGGDLVYLDPPYVTRHDNNGFVDYNETLFSWKDQERLAKRARALAKAGAYVIVSNANHHEVAALYKGFKQKTLTRASTLASDSSCRVKVKEAVFYSPNCMKDR